MQKEIPVIYTPASFSYNPPYELFNGKVDTASETIERVRMILTAVAHADFTDIRISKVNGLPYVLNVHDSEYVDYIKRASDESKQEKSPIFPSVHPYVDFGRASNHVAERGQYVFDTYTPILPETYNATVAAAACAVEGAKVLMKEKKPVYALTRPPGHHAEKAKAGGYCYANNAAIAAQFLLDSGAKKVCVFDFDVHHGNGTQDIFYERADVLVVNIHAAPEYKFPYFTGYADEHGVNEGEGSNYNFPLNLKTGDEAYDLTLNKALAVIKKYKPEYLIASAGFDAHYTDPIGGLSLTTPYYRRIGNKIGELGVPVLSVQEGGYATEVLGQNVISYLQGILD